MEVNRKRVHEICRGVVTATVWSNRMIGRQGWYSVTISRRYMKGREWQSTSSLRYVDVMNARKVLRWAHFWIWMRGLAPARNYW